MWLFLSCTKPITRHFPFFSSKWDENWFKLNIFVLGAVIFGVPNIILLLSYLAFSTRQQGIKLKSKELKSLRYFHFDQWIIELKLNFSFKAHQLETCKHQWTHLNKLKIRFTYNFFFYWHLSASREYFLWHQPGCHKTPSTSAEKMLRLKNLNFTTHSEPYCALCRIPLYSTPKPGITQEPMRFICPTSTDFLFPFLLIF